MRTKGRNPREGFFCWPSKYLSLGKRHSFGREATLARDERLPGPTLNFKILWMYQTILMSCIPVVGRGGEGELKNIYKAIKIASSNKAQISQHPSKTIPDPQRRKKITTHNERCQLIGTTPGVTLMICLNKLLMGLERGSSRVKSTCASFKGLKFSSEHPCWVVHNHLQL